MRQTGKTVSPMSNEGRNLYVVEHITNALISLMEKHSIHDLSISQICDEAQVGRASFYRNFQSKEDVLKKYLQKVLLECLIIYFQVDLIQLRLVSLLD